MSGAGRGEPRGSFDPTGQGGKGAPGPTARAGIRPDHLGFILGDPGHGAAYVLGQGAAQAETALRGSADRSAREDVEKVRKDARDNGVRDWDPDTLQPIERTRRGHHRNAWARSDGGDYDGLRNA